MLAKNTGQNLGEKRISDEREKVRSINDSLQKLFSILFFHHGILVESWLSRVQQEYQAELWNLVLDDWRNG
jgi:hypothetical protein